MIITISFTIITTTTIIIIIIIMITTPTTTTTTTITIIIIIIIIIISTTRLREIVAVHHDAAQQDTRGLWLGNCRYGMRGSIEVLSREAVEALGAGREDCNSYFDSLCEWSAGNCSWGEEVFMDQCLGQVLGVRRVPEPDRLLVDELCDPPEEWRRCRNGKVAALGPFRSAGELRRCAAAAQQAERYRWVQSAASELDDAGYPTVDVMDGSDIPAVKRVVELKGYAGFVLRDGRAALKAFTWPASEDPRLTKQAI